MAELSSLFFFFFSIESGPLASEMVSPKLVVGMGIFHSMVV